MVNHRKSARAREREIVHERDITAEICLKSMNIFGLVGWFHDMIMVQLRVSSDVNRL